MHRIAAFSLMVFFLFGFAGAYAADPVFADGFEPPRWVQGYYVGYERTLYPIAEVDFSSITHLMIGRVRPLIDGTLTQDFDIDTTNGPIWAHAAADAAHAAGRKAILMVGGAGEIDGWRGAATAAKRATFVSNLLAVVDNYHFDGLDLDWEPLETSDQANFFALAQALRSARPGLLLTVPLGWINANFAATPYPFLAQIAPLFDRINVMTYDMAGDEAHGWTGWQSWHNSALHGQTPSTPSSVAVSVSYFLANGVPASKLGFGVAFYGYCWRGVTAPLQSGGSITASDGTMSYAHIVASYSPPAMTRVWDTNAHVPYLTSASPVGDSSCTFVSYDDAQSIAEKGAYAKSQGLGGAIIWTISQGHVAAAPAGQRDPLLAALRTSYLQ